MPVTARRAVSVVELLVALVLSAIVLGAFTRTLIGQRRGERAIAAAHGSRTAAADALRVVSALLARAARGDTLWLRGDTALEWRSSIGGALACTAAADSVAVPTSGAGAWWESAPDSGDAVDIGTAEGTWRQHEIVGVRAGAAGGTSPCGGAHYLLRLRDTVTGQGPPVARVTRRTRMMIYRGGDGAWWLGERRCAFASPAACGSAQPVAGPLARAADGLRFTVDSTATARVVRIVAASGMVSRFGRVTHVR